MDKNTGSIVASIKKMLGLNDDYTPFDTDVLIHINSSFLKLHQLGVGPKDGFTVSDYNQTWSDFEITPVMLGAVKTFVYLQVKMMFDPPANSYVMDAMKQQVEEIGWRLNVQAESTETFDWMDRDKKDRRSGSGGTSGLDVGSSGAFVNSGSGEESGGGDS